MALPETSVLTRTEILTTINTLSNRRNQVKDHTTNPDNPEIVKEGWKQTLAEIDIIQHKLCMQLNAIDIRERKFPRLA